MTSWPCSLRRAAAAEESTPPLMATTTRMAYLSYTRAGPGASRQVAGGAGSLGPPALPHVGARLLPLLEQGAELLGGVERGLVQHALEEEAGGLSHLGRGAHAEGGHDRPAVEGQVLGRERGPGIREGMETLVELLEGGGQLGVAGEE